MIYLGNNHLVNLEHIVRDEWYSIIGEVLNVPDAILCAIEDNYSQINLALIDVLIQWTKSKLLFNKTIIDIIMICLGDNYSQIEPAFRDVYIQWINEDDKGNESVLIEAVMKENNLSHEN